MKKYTGFTLVELMIVIAIIGILATVLYPQVTGYFERANDTTKRQEVNQLYNAFVMRYMDIGTLTMSGKGHAGNGQGWINFQNDESYPYSILSGLIEGGYIKNSIKIYHSVDDRTRRKLYMYYFDESKGRFSVSAQLSYPKQEEIDHVQTIENGVGHNGIYTKYHQNYGMGYN